MEEGNRRILRISDIEEYHKKWMEELDFILDSIHLMSEEDKAAIQTYMASAIDDIEIGDDIEKDSYFRQGELETYEEKIKATKQEIKYLKKLRKKKEELEEKKTKRYKILRKLYKEGRLDPELEDEYRKLRQEIKYRKTTD
ncbi:hypothetical protein [Thermotalea metallivorans]|uniref:Uncharacterized protein n=1 Tax=Thermotalea metallivorans TaxID=520762 RepID=A0A140L6J3_9FIRM|nr:hypothetical protein [Thermotalea metallivorans]KXG76168.1 hypothetical protein AN619_11250 [Thermotalea metallivorans]